MSCGVRQHHLGHVPRHAVLAELAEHLCWWGGALGRCQEVNRWAAVLCEAQVLIIGAVRRQPELACRARRSQDLPKSARLSHGERCSERRRSATLDQQWLAVRHRRGGRRRL